MPANQLRLNTVDAGSRWPRFLAIAKCESLAVAEQEFVACIVEVVPGCLLALQRIAEVAVLQVYCWLASTLP